MQNFTSGRFVRQSCEVDATTRPLVFLRERHGLLRTAGRFAESKDHGAVRINDVCLRADRIGRGFRLHQTVTRRDYAILGYTTLGAPTAMWHCVFNGRVEATAISAGLATRDYFGDIAHDRPRFKRSKFHFALGN